MTKTRAQELEALLSELLDETVKELLVRLRSGELPTKDFAVITKLLKDNNITLEAALAAEPEAKGPKLSVPFDTDEAQAI